MKRTLGLIALGVLFVATIARGASVLFPNQGGTGISTTTIGNVGKALIVSSTSPLVYTFGDAGGSSDPSGWSTTSTYVYLSTSTNKVGIGTSTPSSKLSVSVPSFGDPSFSVFDGAYSYNIGYGSRAQGSNYFSIYKNSGIVIFDNAGNGGYEFQIDGSPKVTIQSVTGNVGIGTTAPSSTLHVVGSGAIVSISSGGTSSNALQLKNTGTGVGTGVSLSFSMGGAEYSRIQGLYGSSAQELRFYNSNLTTPNMMIDSSGNVGIGTTAPGKLLDVNGVIRGWSDGAVDLASTVGGAALSTEYINNPGVGLFLGTNQTGGGYISQYIQAVTANGATAKAISLNPYGGNVGIGTTNPNGLLTVSGGITDPTVFANNSIGQLHVFDPSTSSDRFSKITFSNTYSAGGANAAIGAKFSGSGSSLYFGTSNAYPGITNSAMVISPAGNIGIGNANPPSSRLHVEGTGTQLSLSDGTSTALLYVASDTQNPLAEALYIKAPITGGGRMYLGGNGGGIYALNLSAVSNLEAVPALISSAGATNLSYAATGQNSFALISTTAGGNIILGTAHSVPGYITGISAAGAGIPRRMAFKSYADASDFDTPTSSYIFDTFSSTSSPVTHTSFKVNGSEVASITSSGTVKTPYVLGTGNTLDLGSGGIPWFQVNVNGNLDSTYAKGFTFANVAGLTYLGAAKIALGTATLGDYSGTLITSNIGLGTATPTRKLSIDDATSPIIGINVSGTENLVIGADGTGGYLEAKNSKPLSFYTTGGGESIRILNDGSVSIGATTTAAKLDVNGYALFQQAYGSLAEFTGGTTTGSTSTLTTQGAFYAWKGASSTISHWAGTNYVTSTIGTIGTTTSTLTIGTNGGGTYQLSFSASLAIDTSNHIVHCSAFKNGTEIKEVAGETKLANASDEKTISSGPAYISLVPNDVIDLRCADETGGGQILTYNHVNFGLNRIGK